MGRRAPLISAREVARDNLSILEARYKNGDALVIEFLDAQNDLTTAEQQLADATAQLYLSWLELEASLGKVLGAAP
jgi:outer membrane protein TolC